MRIIVLSFVACLVLACSKNESAPEAGATEKATAAPSAKSEAPPARSPSAADEPSPSIADATAANVAGPQVKLVSPGDPPQRPLRWKLAAGQKQKSIVTIKRDVQTQIDGQQAPIVSVPALVMDMVFEVKEVAPTGDATVELSIAGARAETEGEPDPRVLAAIQGVAAAAVGVRGTYKTDSRGFIENMKFEFPPNAPPMLQQTVVGLERTIRRMTPPLPEEPIGANGSWEVKERLTEMRASVEETSTVRITSLGSDSAEVGLKIEQVAPKQTLTPPGAPPGREVELLGLRSDAKGKAKWDLDRVAPVAAELSTKINMHLTDRSAPDGPHDTKVVMEMKTSQVTN